MKAKRCTKLYINPNLGKFKMMASSSNSPTTKSIHIVEELLSNCNIRDKQSGCLDKRSECVENDKEQVDTSAQAKRVGRSECLEYDKENKDEQEEDEDAFNLYTEYEYRRNLRMLRYHCECNDDFVDNDDEYC